MIAVDLRMAVQRRPVADFALQVLERPDFRGFKILLLGICFLRGALEVAVEGIGDGEKGGYFFLVVAMCSR